MALISVGIDHENASLDLLERATVLEHEWNKVLRSLLSQRNIHEAVFVSTCLRTEVVAVIDRFHGAIEEITHTLSDATGLDPSEFADHLSVHFDRGVATHLFSVAAGLKSVVPGEFEILGQLRRALELATEEQTAGPEITELFQRAISTGRRVRSETQIARGTTSFAQASVMMATEELGVDLEGANVLIIGAGQLAGGIARSLLARPARLTRLTIANRTASTAQRLLAELGDDRVALATLEDVATLVTEARLVVAAVEVAQPVVTRDDLARCRQRVLIVDLGLPRAVSSDMEDLENVQRIDIGDLRERVGQALGDRRESFEEARAIVDEDVERYLSDQRARGAAAIVSELREHFDDVVSTEMARRESELDDLTPEQREKVASLLRSVVAKIAHHPTVALKEAAGTDQGTRLSEATRNLFDL
ncbi:MAG TPA: glutamyl-tRNA reductase [Acidimicrobiales bacterium]